MVGGERFVGGGCCVDCGDIFFNSVGGKRLMSEFCC